MPQMSVLKASIHELEAALKREREFNSIGGTGPETENNGHGSGKVLETSSNTSTSNNSIQRRTNINTEYLVNVLKKFLLTDKYSERARYVYMYHYYCILITICIRCLAVKVLIVCILSIYWKHT